jgi:hypothetical protein
MMEGWNQLNHEWTRMDTNESTTTPVPILAEDQGRGGTRPYQVSDVQDLRD